MTLTATYSPDDNKLRLYASARLDSETYARVQAAGFKWAPKQQLFVAPAWTPGREDLLIDLCGEIGDDDSSLTERAEERADRFDGYSEKRLSEAEAARKAVDAIAEHIPFGQPILIGHHSEKHARRDKEKIDSGMRKAVKLWKTSTYWTARAAGAIAHAKYKELPGVRHRRIKGIESDKRKSEKTKAEAAALLKIWAAIAAKPEADQLALALHVANVRDRYSIRLPDGTDCYSVWSPLNEGKITPAYVAERRAAGLPRVIERCDRWIEHFNNRLAYENAMLAEKLGIEAAETPASGSVLANRWDIAKGGQVLAKGRWRAESAWFTVVRVNKSNGAINSVTVEISASGDKKARLARFDITSIHDYKPPTDEGRATAKAAAKQNPICNYPGDGFREMTESEWNARNKWSDFPYIGKRAATETHGAHRVRQMPVPGKFWEKQQVYLTDAKRKDPPAIVPPPAEKAADFIGDHAETAPQIEPADDISTAPAAEIAEAAAPVAHELVRDLAPAAADFAAPSPAADFEAMAATLRSGGVQVVAAPQLFPTPPELARRVVELATVTAGQRVLEPSAGTGALMQAVWNVTAGPDCVRLVAIEINLRLVAALRNDRRLRVGANNHNTEIHDSDFLECSPDDFGLFDRVVMNPPLENGADIKHIQHARRFLKPGGRLVAICANGPRQRAALQPVATEWHDLPAGSFKSSGTMVNTALIVIDG